LPKLICVDPAYVDQIWPIVSDLVKRAIDRGFSSFSVVEANVLDGLFLLWLVIDREKITAATITSLVGDACEIVATAGTGVNNWVHLIEGIEKYARAEGCVRVRIIGRKGWARLLPDYKQTAVVLERHI
jgi:hypothetical protein